MTRYASRLLPVVVILGAALIGVGIGWRVFETGPDWFNRLFSDNAQVLFLTRDSALITRVNQGPLRTIGWADLMPDTDKQKFNQYQLNADARLEDQLLNAIEASFDTQYKSVLQSTVGVSSLHNQLIQLHGFIVPLEANDERQVTGFFLVPYFGACLHFPPPPANQMVFVRSPEGFTLANINAAYTVSGVIQTALYEDPAGTAAYVMDAVRIETFYGQPDDVRVHEG